MNSQSCMFTVARFTEASSFPCCAAMPYLHTRPFRFAIVHRVATSCQDGMLRVARRHAARVHGKGSGSGNSPAKRAPAHGLGLVLHDALAALVHPPEVVLRARVALLGRLAVPA